MSKFCIDLEGMMLPDAIAAVVDAWYDAQIVSVLMEKPEPQAKPECLDLDIEFKILDNKCKQQILDYLYKLIKSRLLNAGEKMPSIRDLAEKIGFHRNSVLKAYKELEKEGAILAVPGSGFYIKDTSKLMPANAI